MHEQFEKGEARLFLGALLFSRVLRLRHLVFWLALCLASLSLYSSASALGSLFALIPSLSSAFHSLPPSLKTQPSQLPQATEGQSEAFKGTVTAAIILLSHRKSISFPTDQVWKGLCSYCVHRPTTTLYVWLTYWFSVDMTSPVFESVNMAFCKKGKRALWKTIVIKCLNECLNDIFICKVLYSQKEFSYWVLMKHHHLCQGKSWISLFWLQIMWLQRQPGARGPGTGAWRCYSDIVYLQAQ